jgi:hypothetical protein
MRLIHKFLLTSALLIICTDIAIAEYQVERPVFSGGGGQLIGTQFQIRTIILGQNMTPMKISNTSYSTQANSGYVLMLARNNAPNFNGTDDYFVADNLTVNPDEFDGATIREVLKQMPDTYSDIDMDTDFGVAITNVSNTNGQWQYSTNNGQSWTDIFSASNEKALLLADDNQTRLRFKPNMDYMNGYPGDITFRIWDQYRGSTGDDNINLNDSSWVYTVSKNSGILIGNIMAVPVAVPSMDLWGVLFLLSLLVYFSFKKMHPRIRENYALQS